MREITSGFAAIVIFTRLQEMGFCIWFAMVAAILFGHITALAFAYMLLFDTKKDRPHKRDGQDHITVNVNDKNNR